MVEQLAINLEEKVIVETNNHPSNPDVNSTTTTTPTSAIEKFKANQRILLTDIKNQSDAVLYHLQEEGSITTFDGFKEWGITRMGAVIHTLRHKHDIVIESEDVETQNRFKHTVVYSRYKLKKD